MSLLTLILSLCFGCFLENIGYKNPCLFWWVGTIGMFLAMKIKDIRL